MSQPDSPDGAVDRAGDAPTEARTEARPGAAGTLRAHRPTRFGLPLADAVYVSLAAAFAVVMVLTNIVGTKLFQVFEDGRPDWMPGEGALVLTSGIITYPLTFLLTDLVAEIWGRRRADLMVVLGFVMSLLMLGIVHLAIPLPPGSFWSNADLGWGPDEMQEAFSATFAYPGLLLGASMLAYLVAQLFDVRLYHFWWRITKGRHMWIRNNGSTAISQLMDTIIVNCIFLPNAFGLSWPEVWTVIVANYVCKLLLAALDTPLIYAGRALLRRLFELPSDAAPGRAPLGE